MRINLFGPPGVGKSTAAAAMYARLKKAGVNVESVTEYAKSWVTRGLPVKRYDQIYFFGKQQQYEYRWLANGVAHIITDSPVFLSVMHALKYGAADLAPHLWELTKLYDAEHPCLNILLKRGNYAYQQQGRFQTEGESAQFGTEMRAWLTAYYGTFHDVPADDEEALFQLIMRHV